jgi:NADH-quinone oxidoreductase subunit J
MSAGSFLFAVCAIASVMGALGTVFARNPVRGAVGLLVTVVGIAGLFIKLSAQFLAAIQLIVYAGAVVVLFVFVIMLLGPDAGSAAVSKRAPLAKGLGATLLVLMAGGVVALLVPASGEATRFSPALADHGTVESVGTLLFSKGIIPFEIATVLLIVAVVGAIAVARGGKPGPSRLLRPSAKDPREFFVGPLHPRDAQELHGRAGE